MKVKVVPLRAFKSTEFSSMFYYLGVSVFKFRLFISRLFPRFPCKPARRTCHAIIGKKADVMRARKSTDEQKIRSSACAAKNADR